jgi:hypothetical protein
MQIAARHIAVSAQLELTKQGFYLASVNALNSFFFQRTVMNQIGNCADF